MYNAADLVKTYMHPSDASGNLGEMVTYTYLPQMLLDTVIGTTTYVKNTDYDAAGRVETREFGIYGPAKQMRIDYTYHDWIVLNGQGRLSQVTSGILTDLDSLQNLRYTTLAALGAGYDANGNVMTIQDYVAGSPQTQTFTYDDLDRLTSAEASGGTYGTYALQNYTYNGTTGNLATKAGVNLTTLATLGAGYGDTNHDHTVTAMGVNNTYGYDANGNQSSRNIGGSLYTLTYDSENRLTGVSGAASAAFVYDGDGNRVKGSLDEITTTYIGNYFEWTGSTSTMKSYYYAGSTRVAMRTGNSTLHYLLGDHPSLPLGTGLDSTSITTDYNGVRVAEERYMPWGESRYTYGTTPTTFKFTGQRLENSFGLYFYNARWSPGKTPGTRRRHGGKVHQRRYADPRAAGGAGVGSVCVR